VTLQTVSVPDIGGTEGAEIVEISIAVGDTIEPEQAILVLETDKASMDVPCPVGGTVKDLKVSVGDKVSEGDALIDVEVGAAAAEAPAQNAPVAAPVAASSSEITVTVPEGAEGADIIELAVAEGDTVEEGDSLVVLETDKASMEIPAPQAGTVVKFLVAQGDKTVEGGAILTLAVAGVTPAEEAPVAAAAPAASTGSEVVTVPDGAEDADVIEVIVAVGDTVEEGDSLIVLETDKASMEVPSPKAGKVLSIAIAQGDKTAAGGELLTLEVVGSAPVAAPAPTAAKAAPAAAPKASPAKADEATVIKASQSKDVYAGPAVRKFAREMGVDLTQVSGTGDKGRISKDDVKVYVKDVMTGAKPTPAAASGVTGGSGIPPIPPVDFAQFGEIEMLPMSKIKKLTAMNTYRAEEVRQHWCCSGLTHWLGCAGDPRCG